MSSFGRSLLISCHRALAYRPQRSRNRKATQAAEPTSVMVTPNSGPTNGPSYFSISQRPEWFDGE